MKRALNQWIVLPAAIAVTIARDPADDKVLACALASADLIVSSDAYLLALKRYHAIDIATPTGCTATASSPAATVHLRRAPGSKRTVLGHSARAPEIEAP